jgi:hypothetical protein
VTERKRRMPDPEYKLGTGGAAVTAADRRMLEPEIDSRPREAP